MVGVPEMPPAASTAGIGAVLAFGAVAAALFAVVAVRDEFTGLFSDAAVYLLLADHFSPYRHGGAGLGSYLLAHYPFPPLYPLVLGVLGGGSEEPVRTYLAGAALLAAAFAVFFAWLRRERLDAAPAVVLAGLAALLPGTLLIAMGVLSEHLYLLLTLGALVALSTPRPGAALAAGLLVGLSTLARTAGVTAAAALCLFAVAHWRRPELRLAAVVGVLPALVWQIVRYGQGYTRGYAESFLDAPAGAALAALVHQVPVNLHALWQQGVRSFDFAAAAHVEHVVAALGVLAALGFALRLRHARFDALYVAGYLMLILAWPAPGHMQRFLSVVMPLLLYHGFVGSEWIAERAGGPRLRRIGSALYLAVIALVILPTVVIVAKQVFVPTGGSLASTAHSPDWYFYATPDEAAQTWRAMAQIYAAVREAAAHVPRGACVAATAPPYVHFYGQRRAALLPATPGPRFEAVLEECPFVLMMAVESQPATAFPPMYPFALIKDRMRVVYVRRSDARNPASAVLVMLAEVMKAG